MIEEAWVDGSRQWAEFCAALRVPAAAEKSFDMPRVRMATDINVWEENPEAMLASIGLEPGMVDTAAAIYFAGHERQDQAHAEKWPLQL